MILTAALTTFARADGTAQTDPIIWDNGPPTGGAHASQLSTAYPFEAQSADDFRLRDLHPGAPDSYVVTGAQWSGAYWGGGNNIAEGFNLIFYADDGGIPTGAGFQDPTRTALLQLFIPLVDVNETPNGVGEHTFDYSAKLPISFEAQADATYWLGVQAHLTYFPQWGFAKNADIKGYEGVQGVPVLNIPYWTPQATDFAFKLTGVPIPEPGSAMIVGALVLTGLRRRCRA